VAAASISIVAEKSPAPKIPTAARNRRKRDGNCPIAARSVTPGRGCRCVSRTINAKTTGAQRPGISDRRKIVRNGRSGGVFGSRESSAAPVSGPMIAPTVSPAR
jgi:hypothetical protein